MAAAFGFAVDNLFVREHRPQRRAPIHRHLRHVREALFVELLEYPLRPAVILGVGRVDLAVPVVGEAERADLFAEAVDVLFGRDGGVRARLHGILLGWQAERVPPHGMQDVEAFHALVAAEDVGGRVAFRVSDMEARAGGVREHVEAVELRLRTVFRIGLESLVFKPILLPFFLYRAEIVVHGRGDVVDFRKMLRCSKTGASGDSGDPDPGSPGRQWRLHAVLARLRLFASLRDGLGDEAGDVVARRGHAGLDGVEDALVG